MEHLDRYQGYLADYDDAFRSLGSTPIDFNLNVHFTTRALQLSGEINRVDLLPDGYVGWLFLEDVPEDWEDELRMPILQSFIADHVAAPLSEVRVGVYSWSEAQYTQTCFDSNDVAESKRQLDRLARRIARIG